MSQDQLRTHGPSSRPLGSRISAARLCGITAVLLALAASVSARAATPVDLRPDPSAHGAAITLADLFDGASGGAGGVVVARAPAPGLQAVLDADRVQAVAAAAGLDWPNAHGVRRIIVTSTGSDPQPSQSQAERRPRRGAAHGQALVYARNVMAGEIIAASDLAWSDEAVAGPDSPGDPDAVIGKAARRPLRNGAAVEGSDLVSPKVVKRNDTVAVAFQGDGIVLTLDARAMSDGAVGDAIEVLNPQSKKVIQVVVSGPGQAVVGPAADALKAAAFGPALRTASLQ